MTLFFVFFISVIAGLHAYIGWRLIPRGKRWLWILVALSAASIPLTFVAGRYIAPVGAGRLIPLIGFTALGIMGIFAGLVFVRDLFLAGARVAVTDPARREFLRRASAIGVLGAGGAFITEGVISAARPPKVETVKIPIDGLPEALQGFRIAQISDTHLGPTLGRAFLEGVVSRTNELEPDLIAFTGDLADGYTSDLRFMVEPLADLRAKHGAFFVTGNHEYYWQPEEWTALVGEMGLTVLENDHRVLDVGGAKLAVGGVPDREAERTGAAAPDPEKAFEGADRADVKFLLAHRPESLYGAQRADVDLQVCGHTHGGQIFPMNILVYLAHPIVVGLGKFDKTWVYVNRGTAYWGPPMRTGGAGEITVLEFT
ncbi:MAG: metallophosphoesterase [Planctomycetota bacterium]|jgi:predicted MPP superfamily phosphohydrolase